MCWGGGLAVKSTCCSRRWPGFDSEARVALVPGIWRPLLASTHNACMRCMHIRAGTHSHRKIETNGIKRTVPLTHIRVTASLSPSIAYCEELSAMRLHLTVSPEVCLYQPHHRHVRGVLFCDNYRSAMSLGTGNFFCCIII